jgi:carbamoyl-phosphate synthase large subunit
MAVNILFPSVGRRVELLRCFREAYKDLGVEGNIVATDIDPLAPALREADRFYLGPRIDDPSYVSTLIDICRNEAIDLIFPLIDPEIPVLAAARDELQATGAFVCTVDERGARIASDKLETYRFFVAAGIPTPRTWTPDELDMDALAFPLFLKPRFGSAGVDTIKVDDSDALRFFIGRVSDPIIQEFLPGAEITSDVLCDTRGEVRAVVSRQRIEVRAGEVAKGKTIVDPAIIEHSATAARGLGAVGPVTVQCILKDGEPFFTEVNARFGGGVPLGIAAGVRSPHLYIGDVAGVDPDLPPLGEYTDALYITRSDESFVLTQKEKDLVESRRIRP